MNEDKSFTQGIVTHKSRFSAIWILPIVAFLIGMGMVYQQWLNQGIEIVLEFSTAEGLEANKTKVKYRNVDIGTLRSINFSDDISAIQARIEIDRNMQRFLKSDSQFWVVRPRIGSQGVSGISTLLSGAYISIEPGTSEYYSERFIGLDSPPISSPSSAGIQLTLKTTGGKSVKAGNPVIYRGFEVGAVESVRFDVESRQVSVDVFIRSPFDALVTTNTFFWNSGGVSITANTQGLNVDFASMESLLTGGVQFDVPADLPLGEQITQPQTFKLYPSRSSITEEREYEYLEYVILVDDSIGGLDIGAAVEYRGIRIGRVHQPYLGFHQTNLIAPNENRIAVVIHVEPKRITQNASYNKEWFKKQFEQWIKEGLAAQLETANFLTGAMKVSLKRQNEARDNVEKFGKYTVIPLGKGGFKSIISKTDQLLTKLESLPLKELTENANTTISSLNTAVLSANDTVLAAQSLLESIDTTLAEARTTLKGLQPDSPVYLKLESNLQELERTLNMMQPFLQEIRKKPNSLIFSDQAPADIEPKGKN